MQPAAVYMPNESYNVDNRCFAKPELTVKDVEDVECLQLSIELTLSSGWL